MAYNIQYSRYNESSILIEWPAIIDEIILQDVLKFKSKIENNFIKQKIEVINTYSSILIIYQFTIDNVNDVFLDLKKLYSSQNKIFQGVSSTFHIPVCYDDEFGMDLESFSKEKNLSKSKIIELHSKPIYTVYFIGFLPGFLYLGGLNKQLFLDRKTTPNLNVKKGSVAIGGQQTGIYPQNSPGGWHIIGNSPIELFNVNYSPPCLIRAGDKIRFVPIDKQEHSNILKAVRTSNYKLKSTNNNA